MSKEPFVVGIVCSGNTCRSPVTAAWLRESVPATKRVLVWSAALLLDEKDMHVHEEPKKVALEMGLSAERLADLRVHNARDLATEIRPTDLLVWITDPRKVCETLGDGSRLTHMLSEAKRLGATLLPVMEPDYPWEAEQRRAPPEEVRALYKEQGENLRRWAETLARIVA